MSNFFLKKIKWKRSWKADFYLKGVNKQLDKWQEVIQNNGKYTTDLN